MQRQREWRQKEPPRRIYILHKKLYGGIVSGDIAELVDVDVYLTDLAINSTLLF